MIEYSQKWYSLDQHWWLVYFPILCVCFVCLKSIHICCFLVSRMFVIYYKSRYSSGMFYDWKFPEKVQSGSVMMACIFSVLCVCFACLKSIQICFFHVKILLQKLHSPEYSNCDNSYFSFSNLVLQLLWVTRQCRNIFPIFSKKFRLNWRCGRWWMAKSCSGWPFVLQGF